MRERSTKVNDNYKESNQNSLLKILSPMHTEDLKNWSAERWVQEVEELKRQCKNIKDVAGMNMYDKSGRKSLLEELENIERYVRETLIRFLCRGDIDPAIVEKFRPELRETLRAVARNTSRLSESRSTGPHDYNNGGSSIIGAHQRGRNLDAYHDR